MTLLDSAFGLRAVFVQGVEKVFRNRWNFGAGFAVTEGVDARGRKWSEVTFTPAASSGGLKQVGHVDLTSSTPFVRASDTSGWITMPLPAEESAVFEGWATTGYTFSASQGTITRAAAGTANLLAVMHLSLKPPGSQDVQFGVGLTYGGLPVFPMYDAVSASLDKTLVQAIPLTVPETFSVAGFINGAAPGSGTNTTYKQYTLDVYELSVEV